MDKYLEIEFKYSAEKVKPSQFAEFCTKKKPKNFQTVSGYDYFYDAKRGKDKSFMRFRVSRGFAQLTYKKKLSSKNNVVRAEDNLDLSPRTDLRKIESFCKNVGYSLGACLFKKAFIYYFKKYVLVYYIVYDTNMSELGRFIEVEANEDYTFKTRKDALNTIVKIEDELKIFGIKKKDRIADSLYEMFGRS